MTTSSQIPFYIHDFLNAIPVIYPVCEQKVATRLDLRLSEPSRIAAVLMEGNGFSGVIPSVTALKRKDLEIIGSFCIASKGAVRTVCFYSRMPLEEVRSVLLDSRSQTSHVMLKLIFSLKGIVLPDFRIGPVSKGRVAEPDSDGMLIIGDDNILYEKELSSFTKYDLGELWFSLTGKKFVHAVTVTDDSGNVNALDKDLQACLAYSLGHFDEMVRYASERYGMNERFCEEYLRHIILYDFDNEAKDGLKTFFSLSKEFDFLS